jgi:uncharacterized protein YdiU (UPF0061 family)
LEPLPILRRTPTTNKGEVAMSNNRDNINWDIEDEDDEDYTPTYDNDTDLVKKLRKALKAEQRRAKELESNLGEMSKSQKERILKDVFTSRGVNAKIAAFVPNDIEASEEAISAWIDQYADVFGIQQDAPKVSQEDIASMQKMNNVLTNAEAPGASDDIANRLANATSEDEILTILSGQ